MAFAGNDATSSLNVTEYSILEPNTSPATAVIVGAIVSLTNPRDTATAGPADETKSLTLFAPSVKVLVSPVP